METVRVIKVNIGSPSELQVSLREESARLWNSMVKLHKYCRRRHWKWPTKSDLEKHYKGRFNLHSQTIQALIKKFIANIDSTRTKRKDGDKQARYPWRDKKRFQAVMWKASALKRKGNTLSLSNGKGQKRLKLRIPNDLPMGKLVAVELGFRELRLTLSQDVGKVKSAGDNVVAMDAGVIHLGVLTDGVKSIGVVGRGLRSLTQGKNKQLAHYQRLLSKVNKGSRQHRKLRVAKAKMLTRYKNRIHNLLHHAANQMIAFCVEREAGLLVVGDITEMPRNARKNKRGSRRTNQENSGNPLGQLYQYLEYKGKLNGVRIEKINEAYTSQQSPCCPSRYKPRGRTYQCRSCGMTYVRDEVGATNILNKYLGGGKMSVGTLIPTNQVKYLRPVKLRQSVVAPMTEGMLNSATLNSELALSGVGVHTPPVQSFVA